MFRLARILGKQKVLELLNLAHSKGISLDDLLNIARGGPKTAERDLNREALSFILGFIGDKFPEVIMPPSIRTLASAVDITRAHITEKSEIERTRERARSGEVTPVTGYTLPILEALIEMGGSGRVSDVLNRVFDKIKNRLKEKDFQKLPSGISIRWKNKAQWERNRLKQEGFLRKDSPSGVWEITEEGRKLYERLKQKL